ncbi:GntR family transcriptional regulator [Corynebacterium crudilactis]|uniref:HTH gntR-type domain-containing protein n=1 Tax=Corynebacterium crudilactis TaxID=1652495 RepID=A0A172QVF2_9CORY|nr:GntR family transcriptional regulator [Corynebacterium crudilactis]ANE04684.1 hypothetical protein ccrud_11015 [Corynebacterium crudilactis]
MDEQQGSSALNQPIYLNIADQIRTEIKTGDLLPGDRLPAESKLATRFGVARMTIRHALEMLQFEGLIDRRRGRGGGTFIMNEPPEIELTRVEGILPQLREQHISVESTVLNSELQSAPAHVSQALELKAGAQVFNIVRMRRINGIPALLENSYFPAVLFPGLLEVDLTKSLYELLENFSHRPISKIEEIITSRANIAEKQLMGVNHSLLLLRITRTARDESRAVVEYSEDLLRSDCIRIQVKTPER